MQRGVGLLAVQRRSEVKDVSGKWWAVGMEVRGERWELPFQLLWNASNLFGILWSLKVIINFFTSLPQETAATVAITTDGTRNTNTEHAETLPSRSPQIPDLQTWCCSDHTPTQWTSKASLWFSRFCWQMHFYYPAHTMHIGLLVGWVCKFRFRTFSL